VNLGRSSERARSSGIMQMPKTNGEQQRIREALSGLGKWFHNLDLKGVPTAPDHYLGDYPRVKWSRFSHALPSDLRGKSVLDIGCNGGFYSMEMKSRGAARVVAIDPDDRYLAQAKFAAEVNGFDIEFYHLSVYDIARLGERFDVVLFLGVLYHLRHPLLALDLIHEHAVGDLLVVQSMLRGSVDLVPLTDDYPFEEKAIFSRPGFPLMHFVENRYAGDPTNWWIPNRACFEAMLRSAGFRISAHPEEEVYICHRAEKEI
jgi:tRNA (mo5U34)-methyltransferase